jgi:hypothetical protein
MNGVDAIDTAAGDPAPRPKKIEYSYRTVYELR